MRRSLRKCRWASQFDFVARAKPPAPVEGIWEAQLIYEKVEDFEVRKIEWDRRWRLGEARRQQQHRVIVHVDLAGIVCQ